jgi:glutamyl-tRNA reductase
MESLADRLSNADVVVSGVGLGSYVLTKPLIEEALRQRRRKPMFVVDLAVPRDSDPSIHDLDDAYLYDLSDLEQVTHAALAGREAAAKNAWRLVDEGLGNFNRLRAMRAAVPCVVALRGHFESARSAVLKEAESGDAATATRMLINRLLHDPSEILREIAAGSEDGVEKNRVDAVIRRLFRLDPSTESED